MAILQKGALVASFRLKPQISFDPNRIDLAQNSNLLKESGDADTRKLGTIKGLNRNLVLIGNSA